MQNLAREVLLNSLLHGGQYFIVVCSLDLQPRIFLNHSRMRSSISHQL